MNGDPIQRTRTKPSRREPCLLLLNPNHAFSIPLSLRPFFRLTLLYHDSSLLSRIRRQLERAAEAARSGFVLLYQAACSASPGSVTLTLSKREKSVSIRNESSVRSNMPSGRS